MLIWCLKQVKQVSCLKQVKQVSFQVGKIIKCAIYNTVFFYLQLVMMC